MSDPARRLRLLGLGASVAAILVSIAGVPITSAQGMTLYAIPADGALPVDAPFDPAWDRIRALEVPLSGQPVVPPMRPEPAFPVIRVRALLGGDRVAFLLEWDDPTLDDSVLAVDAFADAAAMQFALGAGASICMGQQAGGLNIWHWKADWAADIPARRDVDDAHPGMPDDPHFPPSEGDEAFGPEGFLAGRAAGNLRSAATLSSSVEDLNAVGFGTLTAQPAAGQDVQGASEHRGGVWRVVLSRSLSDHDPNDVVLAVDDPATAIAFAVWDGGRGDRDGQKSVSSWLALSILRPPVGLLDMWPLLLLLLTALVLAGVVLAIGARQPAIGLGGPRSGERRLPDE